MTMYQDPIVWNGERQLLGEEIQVFMNDSSIRRAHVIGQAFSVEKVDEDEHYNQISSKEMEAFFTDGKIHEAVSYGNVQAVYYPIDEKDSTIIVMDYTETDTLRMYFTPERKLYKIWMPKASGTWYPLTQIPSSKLKLERFAWFEDIRPVNKDDIFVWRGKGEEAKLKVIERHAAPLQQLPSENPAAPEPAAESATSAETLMPAASDVPADASTPAAPVPTADSSTPETTETP